MCIILYIRHTLYNSIWKIIGQWNTLDLIWPLRQTAAVDNLQLRSILFNLVLLRNNTYKIARCFCCVSGWQKTHARYVCACAGGTGGRHTTKHMFIVIIRSLIHRVCSIDAHKWMVGIGSFMAGPTGIRWLMSMTRMFISDDCRTIIDAVCLCHLYYNMSLSWLMHDPSSLFGAPASCPCPKDSAANKPKGKRGSA